MNGIQRIACAIGSIVLFGVSHTSLAGPANTLDEFFGALSTCARIQPARPDWSGSTLTVRFILGTDGRPVGPPRVTYLKLAGPSPAHKAFEVAAKAAIAGCFPLSMTDSLSVVMADRHILLTVQGTGPGEARIPMRQR